MHSSGSAVEAQINIDSLLRRSEFHSKVDEYNIYHEGKTTQVESKEKNGHLVLEGLLHVYWRVKRPIHLKPKDESPRPANWRHSYHIALTNGVDEIRKVERDHIKMRRSSMDDLYLPDEESGAVSAPRFNTVTYRYEKKRKFDRRKRLSIINGHLYNLETSVFIPEPESITSVRVSSLNPTPEVIKLLLDKFKVENNPEDFCLCIVKLNGETKLLRDTDYPLIERVLLGPLEDDKVFIMELDRYYEVTEEVSCYMSLPDAMLNSFLKKFLEEEEEEIRKKKKVPTATLR